MQTCMISTSHCNPELVALSFCFRHLIAVQQDRLWLDCHHWLTRWTSWRDRQQCNAGEGHIESASQMQRNNHCCGMFLIDQARVLSCKELSSLWSLKQVVGSSLTSQDLHTRVTPIPAQTHLFHALHGHIWGHVPQYCGTLMGKKKKSRVAPLAWRNIFQHSLLLCSFHARAGCSSHSQSLNFCPCSTSGLSSSVPTNSFKCRRSSTPR